MIRRISQNQVEKVVVLYKDRLLRFGFELIEYIASLYNCEIEIIEMCIRDRIIHMEVVHF